MSNYTIKQDSKNEINIEKSRFICTLLRVSDEDTAYDKIKSIKKTYWDATHNCYAFIIGENQNIQRSSDDGEPSGTAGIPMLEVLKRQNLHNVLAVVTRYFGGIKLGTGGLIRAYTKSVTDALQETTLVQKIMMYDCFFYEKQEDAGKTLNILYNQTLFSIIDTEYDEKVKITIRLKKDDIDKIEKFITEQLSKKVELEIIKKHYQEIDISHN